MPARLSGLPARTAGEAQRVTVPGLDATGPPTAQVWVPGYFGSTFQTSQAQLPEVLLTSQRPGGPGGPGN